MRSCAQLNSLVRIGGFLALTCVAMQWCAAAEPIPPSPLVLPLGRTAYFIGERVPLAIAGQNPSTLAAVSGEGATGTVRTELYRGQPGPLLLNTTNLAPGDYRLELNGQIVLPRLTLTSTQRASWASLQDEASPGGPQFPQAKQLTPEERKAFATAYWDNVTTTLRESGVGAVVKLGAADSSLDGSLDTLARTGTLMLANPDTRPMSFLPTRNVPAELDSMTQRMMLSAQANGKYPNFGGFCYGWDTTGFALGSRRMLLVYWGWGKNENPLLRHLQRSDDEMARIFTERTGLQPVAETEFPIYPVSLKRPDFATMIDLPTKLWLEQIAAHSQPLDPQARLDFERRLDAWSSYLMNMHREVYGQFSARLQELSPSMRHTASIQVDHAPVRQGPYFPSAYAPLDFQYQSTWNDQVGGPDYAYQWLYTQALLEMHRGERPTWISNSMAAAHHRASYPGKFARVAAHGLAYGATGIGFALEGFSNVLGGMAAGQTGWNVIRGKSGGADVLAGRDFLERFATLAVLGRGQHGIGILFSKSQFQRQHLAMGYGIPNFKMLVALVRLGYTPRFVTEEEIVAGKHQQLPGLIILGQTFPLPGEVQTALQTYTKAGGSLWIDAGTTIEITGAKPLDVDLSSARIGKPFNWNAPNVARGDNDTFQFAAWYEQNAPRVVAALGETGRGSLQATLGPKTNVSLLQIDGGRDAKYVVAVNDSHVTNQADWYQVREQLAPTAHAGQGAMMYDLTKESTLGRVESIDCDLTHTTARVYGLLTQPIKELKLAATQQRTAGQPVTIAVQMGGENGENIQAVIPIHLSLFRPNGELQQQVYRATTPAGLLAHSLPLPANAPAGRWSLTARCQLNGQTATLPIEVATGTVSPAVLLSDPVLVRGRNAIEPMLAAGQKLVLPIFDSPQADALATVAETVRTTLAARGVEVEIRRQPKLTKYWLAYDPTPEELAENELAEKGEAFGRIQRTTTNHNDWFAAMSGWRFHRPIVLLDLAGEKDNPMVDSLLMDGSQHEIGLLWPKCDATFPGPGKAIVHGLHWAFAPRTNALVIQAHDLEGLRAAATALANLPADALVPAMDAVRTELWSQRYIGHQPATPDLAGVASNGLVAGQAAQPWKIEFPEQGPPTATQAVAARKAPAPRPAVKIPAVFIPKQLVPFIYDGDRLVEASAAEVLLSDLRFSQALQLTADVAQAGKQKLTVAGQFRYSDRSPMTAAQWADVLTLYEKVVPKKRLPMEIEVLIGGKVVGKLLPSKVAERDVPLEMRPSHGEKEVKKSREEVVLQLSGEIELPAGRQEIQLLHHHIVDGQIELIGVGMEPVAQPEVKK